MVRRLVASGPLSVVVLGGEHDLSEEVGAVGDCEHLRVAVEGLLDPRFVPRKLTSPEVGVVE